MSMNEQLEPLLQQGIIAASCQGINNLYTNKHFCDLKVIISGKVFECHRLILAAVSEFFRSSLTVSWQESSSSTVEIDNEDVTAESFQILLDILYKGHNVISMETVEDLLRMSIYLCVCFLEESCVQFMMENMSADKCLRFLTLALTYGLESVCDCAKETVYKYLGQLHRQAEFASLPKSVLLNLLSEATCSVCSESNRDTCICDKPSMDRILMTVLVWVESDKVRHRHLGELLPFVDPYRLSPGMKQLITIKYFKHEFGGILQTSCIWNNELYVSGSEDKNYQYFAVYRTAQNRWEMLPPPPLSRLDHAIVAVSFNIYFIGGCTEASRPCPVSDILVYHTQTSTWSRYGNLVIAVGGPKVAAVGHRVYIFSGWRLPSWKCEKPSPEFHDMERINAVQCFDTLRGNVYLAGSTLDNLGVGTLEQVISNGAAIFVMDEGHVVQMVENFALADEQESMLACTRGIQTLVPLKLPTADATAPSPAFETNKGHVSESCAPLAVETTESATFLSTISSRSIGNFYLEETEFSAYLYNNELVQCTQCEERDDIEQCGRGFIHLMGIDIKTGEIEQRSCTLPHTRIVPNIHLLNIPCRYLRTKAPKPPEACYRTCFTLSELASQGQIIEKRRVGNVLWSIRILSNARRKSIGSAFGLYFCMVSRLQR
ncbi:hypothetical protein BaRGS_00027711 [Batillaria attramentaria]|uniref:BTB domain-containing protein n=1 Tax=Batillaria attramentaria TaxID=370345 RepID=A0ABD0K2K8_9CAEN